MIAKKGSSTSRLVSQIDKARQKYNRFSTINRILDRDPENFSETQQKINVLTTIIKEIVDDSSKHQKEIKILNEKLLNKQDDLYVKDRLIENYRRDLLKSQQQFYELQNNTKKLSRQQKTVKENLENNIGNMRQQKQSNSRKILSMQKQVNYLMDKKQVLKNTVNNVKTKEKMCNKKRCNSSQANFSKKNCH